MALAAVARAAGVGIGTLYRHFATKEALVEAVYRAELDALEQDADDLLANRTSFDAMRHWLDRYSNFVATKHAMHDALRIALSPRTGAVPETRSRVNGTIAKFLAQGARDGGLRQDFQPDDVTLAFAGAVYAVITSPDGKQIGRVLDLLMSGLRPVE